MNFVYGVLTATVAIIVFEIVKNYALGDKVKDLGLWIYRKITGKAKAVEQKAVAEIRKVL